MYTDWVLENVSCPNKICINPQYLGFKYGNWIPQKDGAAHWVESHADLDISERSTVQYSTAHYSTVQYSTLFLPVSELALPDEGFNLSYPLGLAEVSVECRSKCKSCSEDSWWLWWSFTCSSSCWGVRIWSRRTWSAPRGRAAAGRPAPPASPSTTTLSGTPDN